MIKAIPSLVLMIILSSLAFGIFTTTPSFASTTLQNYTDTNPGIDCSSPNMENNSVHDARRTDSGSIIVDYRYSPSNPHNGCPIEWRLSFEKGYDYTQRYPNVQYDIFTVDDQGKKLSSAAQDNGKTNLFASRGDDDLKIVLKGTTPLTHIVIAVLGTGSDGSIPDTSLAGVVKFDINTSSNPSKNNGNKHALETEINLARAKIAAMQENPRLGTGLYNNWCQPMKSVFFPTGNVVLDDITLQVQVAYCDEQQRRSLMFQNQLPSNQGMLFVYDTEQVIPIGMNMKFPLDIIWFDKDGKVTLIEKNVQPCSNGSEFIFECPLIYNKKISQYVLEVTSGFVDKFHISESSTLKLTDSIAQAVKQSKGNTTIPSMSRNSMSSSNLGLREGEWVKYQITQLHISANDPLVEAEFKSGIMNMLTPQGINSNVSTDWIKTTVKKFSGNNAILDTTVGLSNGTEKDLGEEIFDPKNYTGSPTAIPIDLKIGDIVSLSMNAEPLKIDKIVTIQVGGKNIEAYELTSTTSIYNGGGSVESYQYTFYDKNTGILLVNSLSTSVSGSVFSAKADVTFNAVDFSDDLLKPRTIPTSGAITNATRQDIQNINQAKANQTIAAEVNVGDNQSETKSIDSNVSVQTTSSTPDSLNVNVSASSQTGSKVIAFNLAATKINVQNLKDLGVMYDGKPIPPAPNMDTLLHAKSTDSPSFVIVVTQSGVQVLVLVPHFSTHSITITNMSKVIPTVPEFPFAILALVFATFSIVLIPKIIYR